MKELKKLIDLNMKRQNFDSLVVGVIDFKKASYQCCASQSKSALIDQNLEQSYFDLASVSKPLILALAALIHPEVIDGPLLWLLEHRAGVPAWGRLSHKGWREQIESYPLSPSETLYSDYGALRLMLELEKKLGTSLKSVVSPFWDSEVSFWKDLPEASSTVPTGMRGGKLICGEVHDDNAFVINSFVSHAGLFATIHGVCRTLLKMQKELSFIDKIAQEIDKMPASQRYIRGWDRVMDPRNTLAGKGCSKYTFGHLGFTGTSIWIDPEKLKGHVILTNATLNYWYEREGLSEIRRMIGEWVWRES